MYRVFFLLQKLMNKAIFRCEKTYYICVFEKGNCVMLSSQSVSNIENSNKVVTFKATQQPFEAEKSLPLVLTSLII